jgi:SAM-dependent methyltransferase
MLAFVRAGVGAIVELGCGTGRDTLDFVRNGIAVDALDYAAPALRACDARARERGLGDRLRTHVHDVREPLPFAAETFEGAYAHMLFCMALTDADLHAAFAEVRRVLRAGGVLVFSVRTTDDPDARAGTPLTPYLRDVDGDVIRFFSRACLTRFTPGFEILDVARLEEGPLPKRLFVVTARKAHGADEPAQDAR